MTATAAIRAVVRGEVQGVGFRDATVGRARELEVLGWVRDAYARPGSDIVAERPGSVL